MYASTKKLSEWTKLKYNFIIFAHSKFSIKFNNKNIFPHDQKKKKKNYETVLMITIHLFFKRKLYSIK